MVRTDPNKRTYAEQETRFRKLDARAKKLAASDPGKGKSRAADPIAGNKMETA